MDELRFEGGDVWVVVGEALGGGMTVLGAGDDTLDFSRLLKGSLNREELMRSICGERRGFEEERQEGREEGEGKRG